MPKLECLHCHKVRWIKARRLCPGCYRNHKDEYPPLCEYVPNDREPTAEEVEQMVADGYANLPDWWHRESRRRP